MISESQFTNYYQPGEHSLTLDEAKAELAKRSLDETHLWSVVESDDEDAAYASPGIHAVNVTGFLVTHLPWTDPNEDAVWFPSKAALLYKAGSGGNHLELWLNPDSESDHVIFVASEEHGNEIVETEDLTGRDYIVIQGSRDFKGRPLTISVSKSQGGVTSDHEANFMNPSDAQNAVEFGDQWQVYGNDIDHALAPVNDSEDRDLYYLGGGDARGTIGFGSKTIAFEKIGNTLKVGGVKMDFTNALEASHSMGM